MIPSTKAPSLARTAPGVPRFVAYYRVSTAKQGRSGLGLEAQREAVSRFAEAEGFAVAREFSEAESGKGGGRPESAQGGGTDVDKIDILLEEARRLLS